MKKNIFFKHSHKNPLIKLKNKNSLFWSEIESDLFLKIFNFSFKNVLAYKKFLKSNKFKKVKNLKENLPLLTKDNYLKKYDYLELFPNNSLKYAETFSATSGSSGEPFYLPRSFEQDIQYKNITEIILRDNFDCKNKKSLFIVAFGLGVWIGGIFTYKALETLASEGYEISIIPAGPNKEAILNSIKKFGKHYDQVVLCGYGPFLKDLVDTVNDINWPLYNIKLFTAAEGLSQELKDYFTDKLCIKNPLKDIINIYGTVELGTMAYETPISNLIKQILSKKNESEVLKIFSNPNFATIAQYFPNYINFGNTKNKELFVSGYGSAIPLVKYKLPDLGEVLTFNEIIKRFNSININLLQELKKNNISNTLYKTPFVCVYGRGDSAVLFVGIVLYKEYIEKAFYNKDVLNYLTGKFSMEIKMDKNKNQELYVNIELRENILPSKKIKESIQKHITEELIKNSTEYKYLYSSSNKDYKKRILPKINLLDHGNKNYFNGSGKQKWIIK